MLDAKRLGLAGGLVWGISMFLMTLLAMFTNVGDTWVALMMGVYPGYAATFLGAFIGLAYGFIDGFIGFFLIAWLYNRLKV